MTMKFLLLVLLLAAQRPTSPSVGTGTVTGRLLNDDGSPAAGIRVSAMPSDNANEIMSTPILMSQAETGGDGVYRLADVPAGRYYIIAGFVDSPTYYPRGTARTGATPVVVSANVTVTNIDFRIEKPSTGFNVSGKVIQELPPQTIRQVVLTGGDYGTSIQVDTMLDGSFELPRVRPGNYTVSVHGGQFTLPRPFTVTDKDITGLELRIPWTVDAVGRVTLDATGPIPRLQLAFSGQGRYVTTTTGSNQAFRVTVPEGFFGIIISNLPSGFYVKSITSGQTDLLSQPLRVNRESVVPEILVALGVVTPGLATPGPWVKVSGHISGTRPSPTSRIQLNGPSGALHASIAADGSFEFPRVLPGAHTASVEPQSIWPQTFTLTVPHRDLTDLEMPVYAVREVSGRIVAEDTEQRPRATLIVGHELEYPEVSGPATQPRLAQVLLSRVTRSLQTDYPLPLNIEPDGRFKASLRVGEYPIRVGLPNNGTPSPYSVKSFTYGTLDLTKQPIEITETDTAELRITLAPANARSR